MAAVRVRFWAGAKRAAGTAEADAEAASVSELRTVLSGNADLAKVLVVARFLVDEGPASDETVLHDGAVVDVLPPFAGG